MNKNFIDRSDTLISKYFRDVSKYKMLDAETTNDLIVKAQKGDKVAKDKVVCANLRFVVKVAKPFQNKGIPLIDLISAGNCGLIKAIDYFDTNRGVKFLTYAIWWIKQAIYTSIYWQSREIRLPISQQALIIRIVDATNKFIKKNGRNPNTIELHELTDIPTKQIDYLSQFFNKIASFDDFIGGDEEHSQLGDIIPDKSINIENEVNDRMVSTELDNYLSKLTLREHDILLLCYGIGVPQMKVTKIGELFGLGRERVRQIRDKALERLRKRFGSGLIKLL